MDNKATATMSTIMNRIKNRREELGMSYQDLSDKTNISKSTLQRYETGYIKNMPLDKLGVVAAALNCSPAFIMGWSDSCDSLFHSLDVVCEDSHYNVKEVSSSASDSDSFSTTEKLIIEKYRSTDDMGKAIVLRTLGIDDCDQNVGRMA